jgi:hypothetical protein
MPTRVPLADSIYGLAGKRESWIPLPSLHVLMADPPALPAGDIAMSWHYPAGAKHGKGRDNFSKKSVAPILYIEGHVRPLNLKKLDLSARPYTAEPTPDVKWYKSITD